MSAADASSKNFTIGAGVPRIPCTRPAGCYIPDPAYSPHANNTVSSTCSPAIATSPSKSHGASSRTSPGAYRDPSKIPGSALIQVEIDRLSDTGVLAPSHRSSHWKERSNAEPGTSWPTSTTPTPATATPKPPTAPQKPSTESLNWADESPEATPTPTTTNSECPSSHEA